MDEYAGIIMLRFQSHNCPHLPRSQFLEASLRSLQSSRAPLSFAVLAKDLEELRGRLMAYVTVRWALMELHVGQCDGIFQLCSLNPHGLIYQTQIMMTFQLIPSTNPRHLPLSEVNPASPL